MYTNVDTFNNKRIEFEARVRTLEPDIIGITEVNPKNASWRLEQQELQLPGYSLHCNLEGRGVALFIRNLISTSDVNCQNDESTIWSMVNLKNGDVLLVGVVYRSPSSSDEQNSQLIQTITEMVQRRPSHLLIMGDFNFPGINWEEQSSVGSCQEHMFLEGFRDWFLWQHCSLPTRFRTQQTANILDLVMTNEEGMIDKINYDVPIGKSDHLVLDWEYQCYARHNVSQQMKYLYNKADYHGMRKALEAEDWENLMHGKNCEEQWYIFESIVKTAIEKFVPHRKFTAVKAHRRKPMWMSEKVMTKLRKKKVAFNRWMQTKDGHDYQEYAKARNAAKTETRRAVRDFEKEVAKQAKKNPKAFYRYVNSKLKTRTGVGNLRTKDGDELVNNSEKAEAFSSFFSDVFTREDMHSLPTINKESSVDMSDVDIDEGQVLELLNHLQPDKSPGSDGLHPRVLRECAQILAQPLTIIFQSSLREGCLPQCWKEANITAVYKKGSRSDTCNYRPISLTSVCCKIMEKLIRKAMLKHMMENKLFSEQQHGFVYGRSCTTQLLQVMDKLTEILDKGGAIDIVYLDLAKAFDAVPHQRLLLKLRSYGIAGKLLEWITNFLTGRRQRVGVAGEFSAWREVLSGVPQGSVLGPILFICYINSMPETVSSFLYMYADDTKVFRRVDVDGATTELQKDLDSLVEWSEKWQLRFNADKCKVMHIGGSRNMKAVYRMANSELHETEEEKDLGVWIDNTGKPSCHVSHAVRKANQLLGLIRRSFTYMDAALMKQLFTSIVRPHLEYANVVWHPYLKKDIELLESVQHRASKMVPGLAKMRYEDRLRRMDLPTLVFRRERGDAIEAYKYLHGKYDIASESLLPKHYSTGPSTRSNGMKLKKRGCRSQIRNNFFGMRIVNLWNSLSDTVATAPSVNCFKGRFDRQNAGNRFSMEWVNGEDRGETIKSSL